MSNSGGQREETTAGTNFVNLAQDLQKFLDKYDGEKYRIAVHLCKDGKGSSYEQTLLATGFGEFINLNFRLFKVADQLHKSNCSLLKKNNSLLIQVAQFSQTLKRINSKFIANSGAQGSTNSQSPVVRQLLFSERDSDSERVKRLHPTSSTSSTSSSEDLSPQNNCLPKNESNHLITQPLNSGKDNKVVKNVPLKTDPSITSPVSIPNDVKYDKEIKPNTTSETELENESETPARKKQKTDLSNHSNDPYLSVNKRPKDLSANTNQISTGSTSALNQRALVNLASVKSPKVLKNASQVSVDPVKTVVSNKTTTEVIDLSDASDEEFDNKKKSGKNTYRLAVVSGSLPSSSTKELRKLKAPDTTKPTPCNGKVQLCKKSGTFHLLVQAEGPKPVQITKLKKPD